MNTQITKVAVAAVVLVAACRPLTVERRAQVAVVHGVEKLSNVDLKDPAAPHLHQPLP